jgi:hypothetical protein
LRISAANFCISRTCVLTSLVVIFTAPHRYPKATSSSRCVSIPNSSSEACHQ